MSVVWLRAIRAVSVTMLRSRGARLGRFHTSPSRRSCVYFSSAGATMRMSLSVGIERATSDLGLTDPLRARTEGVSEAETRPTGLAWEQAEASRESDSVVAASRFMGAAAS